MGTTQSTKLRNSTTLSETKHGAAVPLRIVELSGNVEDCYIITRRIGHGSIGSIYLARRKMFGASHPGVEQSVVMSENLYAIKEIDRNLVKPDFLDEMRNEVTLLKIIDHPNILKAYEVYDQTNVQGQQGNISIVMEYCSGGDLNKRSPCHSEHEAKVVVAKVVEAVNYLHHLGITHRDIKPENIMFESMAPDAEIKLIDFGLAHRYAKNQHFKEKVGTVYTVSPQVIKGKYDKQADIWSIGVVAYMLLVGDKPFWGATCKEIAKKVVVGKYSMEDQKWKDISKDAKDFIKKCLQIDPKLRFTADQALKSAWLSEITAQKSNDLTSESTRALLRRMAMGVDQGNNDDMKSSEFRKLVLLSIANKSSRDDILKLREVFHTLDINHDGTLSMEELRIGLQRAGVGHDADKWFQNACVSKCHTGEVSYTEFIGALLETQGKIQQGKLAEAFAAFDFDHSGYITRQDLKDALGGSVDDAYVERLLQEADKSGDGQISFDEFKALINRETAKSKKQFRWL